LHSLTLVLKEEESEFCHQELFKSLTEKGPIKISISVTLSHSFDGKKTFKSIESELVGAGN